MDVQIQARGINIPERFEAYVTEKSEKAEKLADRPQRFDVKVSRVNDKAPNDGDRVEITVLGAGPVVRAESEGSNKYTAFDLAYGKLLERLRRGHDRRVVSKGRPGVSLRKALADGLSGLDIEPASPDAIGAATGALTRSGGVAVAEREDEAPQDERYPGSPIVIRKKEFPAVRLTAEQAVDQMELVGHDFYLFVDIATGKPSVVYRRRGWSYGVIRLADEDEGEAAVAA